VPPWQSRHHPSAAIQHIISSERQLPLVVCLLSQ
jgi:hypothetical protein